jgi:putative endonuclease
MSSFQVYILFSKSLNQFYKGQTSDITDRLKRHNNGFEKSTKNGIPWLMFWKCDKQTRSEALNLERKIKNLSIRRTIDFMLKYKEGIPSSDELLHIQKLSEH